MGIVSAQPNPSNSKNMPLKFLRLSSSLIQAVVLLSFTAKGRTKKCFLNGKILEINRLGIEPIKRDKGTAYHTSEGIFCSYGRGVDEKSIKSEEIIDTCRICPTILNLYGIDVPDYMQKPFF